MKFNDLLTGRLNGSRYCCGRQNLLPAKLVLKSVRSLYASDDYFVLAPVMQEQFLRDIRSGAQSGDSAKFVKSLETAHEATKVALKQDACLLPSNRELSKIFLQ